MIEFVPFRADYFRHMTLQTQQRYLSEHITHAHLEMLETSEHAYAALDQRGRPLGAGGAIQMWRGVAVAWAFLTPHIPPRSFIRIHRATQRFLDSLPYHRVEATVDADHEEGHRWVRALGFVCEAKKLRGRHPDGTDCAMYARVRLQ